MSADMVYEVTTTDEQVMRFSVTNERALFMGDHYITITQVSRIGESWEQITQTTIPWSRIVSVEKRWSRKALRFQ